VLKNFQSEFELGFSKILISKASSSKINLYYICTFI